jgi:hypothetical protein
MKDTCTTDGAYDELGGGMKKYALETIHFGSNHMKS